MAGFETRSSRLLQEAGFLRLLEETVATPDGDEITRYVVRHPGAVVIVPLDEAERVVLVRQHRVAVGRELLEVPAGKREPDEAPEGTAARELAEEVGLSAGRTVPLARFYNSPGFCDEHTHVYLGLDLRSAASDHEAKAEERHMTVERHGLDECLDLVATGEIADAKTVVGVALAALRRDRGYGGMRR